MRSLWSKITAGLAATSLLACAALAVVAVGWLIHGRGGAWRYEPEDAEWLLSDATRKVVDQAYAGLEDATIRDHHVQLLSLGQSSGPGFDNRSYVNPELLSWWHPVTRIRSAVYLSAAGVSDPDRADKLYLARLLRLIRGLPGHHRLQLLALDQRYDPDGRPQPQATPLFVDNDYVWFLGQRYPDRFQPVVSVHPYRLDADQSLARWAQRGVKTVYWDPAAQGIDPADEKLKPYYRALADNGLTLLADTGAEPFPADGNPAYGNPLRYRMALRMGVTVVMAHCAGAREYPDPDKPDGARKPGYAWFLQMLANPDYEGRLYGDISGLLRRGRAPGALTAILQRPQLFDRLVYASGYPRPAVHAAVDVGELVEDGFITPKQGRALRDLYDVNPLLFDFVAKRLMRLPHTDLGLPDAVFTRQIAD